MSSNSKSNGLREVTADEVQFRTAFSDLTRAGCQPDLIVELAGALDAFGWYVDFHTAEESFVVLAGRVWRYRTGDAAARAEVEAYARSRGVPDAQLDW